MRIYISITPLGCTKMNTYQKNKLLGSLFIVLGVVILLFSAGELLFRLLIAIGALILINYGMRLYGMQSAQQMIMRAWFSRRW